MRLTGVFDRAENLPDGTMQVVDFKTGKPDK
jgi:RecB family exonuclease